MTSLVHVTWSSQSFRIVWLSFASCPRVAPPAFDTGTAHPGTRRERESNPAARRLSLSFEMRAYVYASVVEDQASACSDALERTHLHASRNNCDGLEVRNVCGRRATTPPVFRTLRGGHHDSFVGQRHRADPCQCPAVQRGPGIQSDRLIRHDGALEYRRRSERRRAP